MAQTATIPSRIRSYSKRAFVFTGVSYYITFVAMRIAYMKVKVTMSLNCTKKYVDIVSSLGVRDED